MLTGDYVWINLRYFLVISKKPQVTRWSELCTALSPSLVSLLSDKAVEWICQKPLAPLVIQTVECCTGDVSPILFSLCQSLSAPFENEEEHIVGDPCGHWVLKRLISIKRDNGIKGRDILYV